jgi:energy-coupling factor transporter ATP-binding protein EcfA2
MLTRLQVRNFKTLEDVDIPLGQSVVLIGPNNSGKTTTLQALSLWHTGLQEWLARRASGSQTEQRVGVTVNRKALTHTPVSDTKLLWHRLRVSAVSRDNGTQDTQKLFIDVLVDGETAGKAWSCGLEFYHANSESIYCRPLRLGDGKKPERMIVPHDAGTQKLALLPPMSGLASEEPEVQRGRIAVLLGEGQTAQVLRNLCLQVHQSNPPAWQEIKSQLFRIFGATLGQPQRDPVRGTIDLSYSQNGITLELPSAGRGMQQTLLLLAHLYANPGSALLLDEPDAHLEILRQRQVYDLLTETARRSGSQIIAASHSEEVLNEAADRDVVVAFVGRPHRIDDRGSQLLKSLKEIGFEQYYQAELKGLVIYLEGATDLAILRGLARVLGHRAFEVLDSAFVHYVLNQPKLAEHHFYGLREAKPDLAAVAVFDRLQAGLPSGFAIPTKQWQRRGIENYLCSREVLLRFSEGMEPDDLVGRALREARRDAMAAAISSVEAALKVLGRDAWSPDEKVSDDFLPAVFKRYFEALGTEDRLSKSDFHVLAEHIHADEIDAEIVEALDLILQQAGSAHPAT